MANTAETSSIVSAVTAAALDAAVLVAVKALVNLYIDPKNTGQTVTASNNVMNGSISIGNTTLAITPENSVPTYVTTIHYRAFIIPV